MKILIGLMLFFYTNDLLYNSMFSKRIFFKFYFFYEMDFFFSSYNNIVPKLQPWVSDYIESEFINNVGIRNCCFYLHFIFNYSFSKIFK